MKKLSCCLSVLLLLLSAAEAVLAADSAPTQNTAPAGEKKAAEKKSTDKKAKTARATKATKPQRLTGEIAALDAKAGTVLVKGASGEKGFTTQDAAKDTLDIVKIGDRVRVTYSEKDGKAVATSMKRMKAKPASSETKEKKPTKAPIPQTKDGGESKKL